MARFEILDGSAAPLGERLLRYTCAHFDCVAESPHYARLFQGELMSAGRGGSLRAKRLAVVANRA